MGARIVYIDQLRVGLDFRIPKWSCRALQRILDVWQAHYSSTSMRRCNKVDSCRFSWYWSLQGGIVGGIVRAGLRSCSKHRDIKSHCAYAQSLQVSIAGTAHSWVHQATTFQSHCFDTSDIILVCKHNLLLEVILSFFEEALKYDSLISKRPFKNAIEAVIHKSCRSIAYWAFQVDAVEISVRLWYGKSDDATHVGGRSVCCKTRR